MPLFIDQSPEPDTVADTDPPTWLSLPQGRLLWWPNAFLAQADQWLARLQTDIPWQQHYLYMFGREIAEPRLSCWMGDRSYRYSGKARAPAPWQPVVQDICRQVSLICEQPFNGVLLNWYRDGQDSMGWHADNEPELGINPTIASVSLGATRRFKLRHNLRHNLSGQPDHNFSRKLVPELANERGDHGGQLTELQLCHGSLLVMAGEMQHHWQHSVPKMAASVEPRINLTFRWLAK